MNDHAFSQLHLVQFRIGAAKHDQQLREVMGITPQRRPPLTGRF